MGQSGAKMITLMKYKNLSFIFEAAKSCGVNDAVTVTRKSTARRTFSFRKQPPTGFGGYAGKRGKVKTHNWTIDFFVLNHNIFIMSDTTLTVTPRAAQRIHEIAAKQGVHAALRIAVNGGGCSGFQYDFALDDKREDDDISIERDGAMVLVDSTSLNFMAGSTLDFIDDLMGQSFRIQNPQAKSSCGCGTSFSL